MYNCQRDELSIISFPNTENAGWKIWKENLLKNEL